MTILIKQRKQNTKILLILGQSFKLSQRAKFNSPSQFVCHANFKKEVKIENKLASQTKVPVLIPGTTLDVAITALGSKNRGIVELSNGYTILISKKSFEVEPNILLNVEDKVRVKILKVSSKNKKFVMAELLEILKPSQNEIPLKVGEIREVTLTPFTSNGGGFAQLPDGYLLFVPKIFDVFEKTKILKIQMTRVKRKYALGKLFLPTPSMKQIGFQLQNSVILSSTSTFFGTGNNNISNSGKESNNKIFSSNLTVGKKFNIILPQTTTFNVSTTNLSELFASFPQRPLLSHSESKQSKERITRAKGSLREEARSSQFVASRKVLPTLVNFRSSFSGDTTTNLKTSGNYIIANLNGFVIFLKMNLGAQSGDKVQIEILKMKKKFVLARVLKVSPISRFQKHFNTKYLIKKMLKNGMHFGEKAMKCHSNMKKYIWFKKNRFLNSESSLSHVLGKGTALSNRTFPNLLQKLGGVKIQVKKHKIQAKRSKISDFASLTSLTGVNGEVKSEVLHAGKQNNLKKKPFIKKGRFLVNLLKTRRCLLESTRQLAKYAAKGRTFLFIGTKKPASGLIARSALITKNSFFVNTRWLGGMLTNWKTILKSISKLKPILKEKQKAVTLIYNQRKNLEKKLIEKVNSLRKKSHILIRKGEILIEKVKNDKSRLVTISQVLVHKKTSFIKKNQFLLEKYKELSQQKNKLSSKTAILKNEGNELLGEKKILVSQMKQYKKKLKNLKLILLLLTNLQYLKNTLLDQGKSLRSLSYMEFTQFVESHSSLSGNDSFTFFPSPPKDVLANLVKLLQKKVSYNYSSSHSSFLTSSYAKTNFSLALLPKRATPHFPRRAQHSHFFVKQQVEGNLNQFKPVSLFHFSKTQGENILSSFPAQVSNGKTKVILISKLLCQLNVFIDFAKNSQRFVTLRLQGTETALKNLQLRIKKFQSKTLILLNLKKQIQLEQLFLKQTILSQKEILQKLKKRLRILFYEQRLLSFLPKLRYLSTDKSKMLEIIELLMKKLVDPKLRYPIDKIYDEKLKFFSKKVAASKKKKWQRLEKYFGGVSKMSKMGRQTISKNIAIIVGQKEEINAVNECKNLGIKMFHIADTNSNPRLADYFVPANDDSRNSIKFILDRILANILLAQELREKLKLRKKFSRN